MTEAKEKIAEALKLAIKGEVDGYTFYNLLSEKATNDDARRKLEQLRDDEVRHRATLVGIFNQFVGGEIGELPEKGLSALADVFRKGRLEERKSEMEFIDLAIEAELAAMKFYQDERNMVDDADFQSIFDKLAEEEHSHYELLKAEREALTGGYHWFSIDGTSPMED